MVEHYRRPRILNPRGEVTTSYFRKGEVSPLPDVPTFLSLASHFLPSRMYWRERPKPKGIRSDTLLLSPKEDQAFLVNGSDLRLVGELEDGSIGGKNKLTSVAIVLDPQSEESKSQIQFMVSAAYTILEHEGALFIIEKLGEDREKGWREQIVKHKFLSGGKVIEKDGYFIWEAKKSKKKKRRGESDISESRWVLHNRHLTEEAYLKLGFLIISDKEVLDVLEHSRGDHRRNIAKVIEGKGYELLCPCGLCVYKINLKKVPEKSQVCSDENCHLDVNDFDMMRDQVDQEWKKVKGEGNLLSSPPPLNSL